jgi:hypothetical protein
MHSRTFALGAIAALCAPWLHAQMQMPQSTTLIDKELQHTTSGTSIEPSSTPMQMLMRRQGDWTLMLHGVAFAADIQQQAANDRAWSLGDETSSSPPTG